MQLHDLFEGNEQAYNWHSEPEQRNIDATRQSRLYREREPEGSEAIDARIRARYDQLDQYNQSGRFWLKQKDTQEHISDAMIGKAAANAAAVELLKQRPELQGNLVITAYGPGESQGVAEGILGSDPNRGQKVPDWAKRGIAGKIGRKLDSAWSDAQMTVPQHLMSKQSSAPALNTPTSKDTPKTTSATPTRATRAIPQSAGSKSSHPATKNVVKTIADKQGVAEGDDDIWGSQGNFAGDKPVNLGGSVSKRLGVDDTVTYFGEKATILAMSKDRTVSRIHLKRGITKNVKTSDLKRVEQGVAEGEKSPMAKDSQKADRIRSLKNLIAIAQEQGRQLRVQELELELKKLQGVTEMDSQGYTGTRDRKKTSKYGSRDDYDLGGPESTGRPLTAKQMMDRAHKAMLKSMSNDEKVDKGWRNPNVDEGAGTIGSAIKSLYRKIYRAGDDEIEYFYNASPIFAQYWDEYEGDLDSIIAEVDPSELEVIKAELESYAQDANLAEAPGAETLGHNQSTVSKNLNSLDLDEGWKEKLGAAALAGSMALGAAGANAGALGTDTTWSPNKPVATQQVQQAPQAQYDVDTGILTYKGKQYKQDINAQATGKGEIVSAPSIAVGSRNMFPTKVELHPNGTYSRAVANEGDIGQLEKDIADAPVAPIANMEADEKIGGRYDPDDFDAMVGRLKKLAGAGPMKTAYDPNKRVYRNVPTAVQPAQQPKK